MPRMLATDLQLLPKLLFESARYVRPKIIQLLLEQNIYNINLQFEGYLPLHATLVPKLYANKLILTITQEWKIEQRKWFAKLYSKEKKYIDEPNLVQLEESIETQDDQLLLTHPAIFE